MSIVRNSLYARSNKNFGLILQARIKDAHMAVTEAAYEASKPALPTEGDEDFSAMVRYMERLNVQFREKRIGCLALKPIDRKTLLLIAA